MSSYVVLFWELVSLLHRVRCSALMCLAVRTALIATYVGPSLLDLARRLGAFDCFLEFRSEPHGADKVPFFSPSLLFCLSVLEGCTCVITSDLRHAKGQICRVSCKL